MPEIKTIGGLLLVSGEVLNYQIMSNNSTLEKQLHGVVFIK